MAMRRQGAKPPALIPLREQDDRRRATSSPSRYFPALPRARPDLELTYFCMLSGIVSGEGRWSCKGDLDATEFGRRAAAWAAVNEQVAAGATAGALSLCPQTRVCAPCKQPPCRALIVPAPCFRILAGARRRSSWPLRGSCEREHCRTTCRAGAAAAASSGGRRDRRSASIGWRTGVVADGRAARPPRDRCAYIAQMAVGKHRILVCFCGSVRAALRAVAGLLGLRTVA